MKIFAFTDLHGDKKQIDIIKKKSKDADVLIDAGDLTVFEHSLDDMIKKLDSIGKPVLIIHGNHESSERMQAACDKTKNVKFLHRNHQVIGDTVFIGYGGGGFNFETKGFEKLSKEFKELVKNKKSVFVIHGPPYDTKLDEIIDDHVGNLTMREFIEEAKPNLVVCGHLHENFGRYDFIDKSYVINPGPEGKFFDL